MLRSSSLGIFEYRFVMCCGVVREGRETVGEGSFVPFGVTAVDRDFSFRGRFC